MFWLLLAVGLSVRAASPPTPTAVSSESLPALVRHACSFEQLANSRYSVHSGFNDSLPRQVLANVLWAMSRAPHPDSGDREFYVATADNVYRLDPSQFRLIVHRAGDHRYNSSSAFEVGVATSRPEDAGLAIQAGLLAGAAFNTERRGTAAGEPGVGSCPMQWAADHANADWKPAHRIQMVNVYGRVAGATLETLCAVRSSDSSLAVPHVVGPDTFEAVMADLGQDSLFGPVGLSDENVSQLLWAAYGVTPHLTFNRRQGLTVPSAMANYYLTDRIYVVGQYDVSRYYNRLAAGTDATTRDHRLGRTIAGDRRPQLRVASARIPGSAPAYFVVCVPDTAEAEAMMEAGFAGFQLLAQARSLGLAGRLVVPLDRAEREGIAAALELPEGHVPALVFACGEAERTAAVSRLDNAAVTIVRAQPAIRNGELRLEYLLNRAGPVRVEVFDMLGRPVRLLLNEQQTSGYHAVVWDGTSQDGVRLKRGTYLIVVISGGTVARHKVDIG
jgi:hypothetical protein